jgi:CubicO group peptidase (beta-lactamase class C family)
VEALRQIDRWSATHAAAAVLQPGGAIAEHGDRLHVYRWASVTKLATALAALVAVEEGAVDLDEHAGPPGATVRHLLAHTSGLPFDEGPQIAKPGERRIYSDHGFDVLARHLEARTEIPFAEYLAAAVLRPLGMASELHGSAGSGLHGALADLMRLGGELLEPTLVAAETLDEATSVQFPGVKGVLPGFGRFDPLDWGLGFELKGAKAAHWSGTRTSSRTFGHFGGAGTFLWVDPERRIALGCLSDREFGEWAKTAWPAVSDAVLQEVEQ